ncbi:unnamed protein product [Heterobilharzia americana]|nr:unnamed protein product [Heterobilharzia americana]CAH8558142.1 unnamed protein product [Heterobilharzia americana]CAH8586674.1 unnamed protein product [Heterobilharzia americana]
MSTNCITRLSPLRRTSVTRRKRSHVLKSSRGLHKYARSRTRSQVSYCDNYLKPHQIECERLKEILPSVANCEKLDEVKIIQEAIKHIDYLEQAVLQRLNIINMETSIETSASNSSSLLPTFIFKLLSSRGNRSKSVTRKNLHLNTFQTASNHNSQLINNDNVHIQSNDSVSSKAYDFLNSSGSTPYQTDEDIDQCG